MEQSKSVVITVRVIPPEIQQYFNRELLTVVNRWEATKELIKQWTEWAKKKYLPGGRKMRDFEEHIEIFEKLYGWQKAEEAYNKAEEKEVMERPVVPTEEIYRLRSELGKNVRNAFWDASLIQRTQQWKNH